MPRSNRGLLAAALRLDNARAALQSSVDEAREQGQSWADIGEALGVTRQAAFKRFGRPHDPRTGVAMRNTTTASSVVALTERVFTLLDAGDHDAIAGLMSASAARTLTREVLLGTWAAAVAETGNLVACRDTRAELGDKTVLHPDESVLGLSIGVTELQCEAGEWIGRLALDGEQRIVGLLVVAPGEQSLPF
ncbi:hypothetical protein [Tessaracoccus antarcticus]|uniref:DUF3887 domain-containing protein n=1 Tax=Tessaracoccus antarcticus TaxID=2479848 RepID=A0A3M0G1H8_9ACTN|nr:hypothetical protein [Tessaracoccus antarcticus]RMB58830.1 hypothetical protein EAX62_11940 [Tessaracoccus antarcticus]